MAIDSTKAKDWHDRIFTQDALELMDYLKAMAGAPEVKNDPTNPYGAYKMQPKGNPDDQGICHHFNNQIGVVDGFLQLIQMPGLTDTQKESYLNLTIGAVDKMRQFLPPAIQDAHSALPTLYPDQADQDTHTKHLSELEDLIKRSTRVRNEIEAEVKAQQQSQGSSPPPPPRP